MDNIYAEHILFPFLGIVISILGKLMIKVKPNSIFGFRLPWTLNDSKSWAETHQYAGRIWLLPGYYFL